METVRLCAEYHWAGQVYCTVEIKVMTGCSGSKFKLVCAGSGRNKLNDMLNDLRNEHR